MESLGGRHVRVTRKTRETDIVLELDLDKGGFSSVSTGLGFFDHMLDQIPHHGGVSLSVKASGDLEVDEHHSIEDVGIALGEALDAALGSKLGIGRYGFVLPMDDCDACVLMDFGGRIDFKWQVRFNREKVGDVPTEMFSHFFQSVCAGAKCNLHIFAEGGNDHHKAESIFKAFARALRMAVSLTPFPYELPSSKGTL
ncbi:MAG: imidazoleglycerol-phosphate dehydratase HisB [Candidatus Cryptobacteroides sp.]